jgi:hypothetical protein
MYELANHYLINQQFSAMNDLLQSLPQNFGMNETEIEDYNYYTDYFAILEHLITGDLLPEDLTFEQVGELESMIESGQHYYVRAAWLLLEQYNNDYVYEEEILHSTTSSPRLAKRLVLNKTEKEFSLFPNPAFDYFILKYTMPEAFSKLTVEVVDVSGRLLQISQVSSNVHELLLDAKELKPGLYLVILRGDGRILASERLIISK